MTPEIIQKINSHLAVKPNASRGELCEACGITRAMLDRTAKAGLVKLPPPMSYSQAAKIGRRKAEAAGKRFVINRNKPQVWQEA